MRWKSRGEQRGEGRGRGIGEYRKKKKRDTTGHSRGGEESERKGKERSIGRQGSVARAEHDKQRFA